MNKSKYAQPDFISYEELFEKLGYKRNYQPKIGDVGRAIIQASKNHRSVSWLKKQLDTYFDKLRGGKQGKHKDEKRRNRHSVQRNAQNEA